MLLRRCHPERKERTFNRSFDSRLMNLVNCLYPPSHQHGTLTVHLESPPAIKRENNSSNVRKNFRYSGEREFIRMNNISEMIRTTLYVAQYTNVDSHSQFRRSDTVVPYSGIFWIIGLLKYRFCIHAECVGNIPSVSNIYSRCNNILCLMKQLDICFLMYISRDLFLPYLFLLPVACLSEY